MKSICSIVTKLLGIQGLHLIYFPSEWNMVRIFLDREEEIDKCTNIPCSVKANNDMALPNNSALAMRLRILYIRVILSLGARVSEISWYMYQNLRRNSWYFFYQNVDRSLVVLFKLVNLVEFSLLKICSSFVSFSSTPI